MVGQVVLLMWLRTVFNYQHSLAGSGMSMIEVMKRLYAEGGVARFYQGMWVALFLGPLAKFGDTAAYDGTLALLSGSVVPKSLQVFCSSCLSAMFRVLLYPLDTYKTIVQVNGVAGLKVLRDRLAEQGYSALFEGAASAAFTSLTSHYPFFWTYNTLNRVLPEPQSSSSSSSASPSSSPLLVLCRNALLGFLASCAASVASNPIRMVKTLKQTSPAQIGYWAVVDQIVRAHGVTGLLFTGLGTKVLASGLQAILFTVLWRYFHQLLLQRQQAAKTQSKTE